MKESFAGLQDAKDSREDERDRECALDRTRTRTYGPRLIGSTATGTMSTAISRSVCQFINFWRGDTDNEGFKRLRMLVRGEEAQE